MSNWINSSIHSNSNNSNSDKFTIIYRKSGPPTPPPRGDHELKKRPDFGQINHHPPPRLVYIDLDITRSIIRAQNVSHRRMRTVRSRNFFHSSVQGPPMKSTICVVNRRWGAMRIDDSDPGVRNPCAGVPKKMDHPNKRTRPAYRCLLCPSKKRDAFLRTFRVWGGPSLSVARDDCGWPWIHLSEATGLSVRIGVKAEDIPVVYVEELPLVAGRWCARWKCWKSICADNTKTAKGGSWLKKSRWDRKTIGSVLPAF